LTKRHETRDAQAQQASVAGSGAAKSTRKSPKPFVEGCQIFPSLML